MTVAAPSRRALSQLHPDQTSREEEIVWVRLDEVLEPGKRATGFIVQRTSNGDFETTGIKVTVFDRFDKVGALEFGLNYGIVGEIIKTRKVRRETAYECVESQGIQRFGKTVQAVNPNAIGDFKIQVSATANNCSPNDSGFTVSACNKSGRQLNTDDEVLLLWFFELRTWYAFAAGDVAPQIQGGICFTMTGNRTRLTQPNVHGTAPVTVEDAWGNVVPNVTALGNQETVYFCERLWSAAVAGCHGLAIYNSANGAWIVVACQVLAGKIRGKSLASRVPATSQDILVTIHQFWGAENDIITPLVGQATSVPVRFMEADFPQHLIGGWVEASLDSIGTTGVPVYRVTYADQMAKRLRVVLQEDLCCGASPVIDRNNPPAVLDYWGHGQQPPQVGGVYQYGFIGPRGTNDQAKAGESIWLEWDESRANGHIDGWVVEHVERICVTIPTNLRLVPGGQEGECDKLAWDDYTIPIERCADPVPQEISLGEAVRLLTDVRDNAQDSCIKEKVSILACVRQPSGGFDEQVTPFLEPVTVTVLVPTPIISPENDCCIRFFKRDIKVYCDPTQTIPDDDLCPPDADPSEDSLGPFLVQRPGNSDRGVAPTPAEANLAMFTEGQVVLVQLQNGTMEWWRKPSGTAIALVSTVYGPNVFNALPPTSEHDEGEYIDLVDQIPDTDNGHYRLTDTGGGVLAWVQESTFS